MIQLCNKVVLMKLRIPVHYHDEIWHAYADRSGDGSYLKKIDPHQRGVKVGILGCPKIREMS